MNNTRGVWYVAVLVLAVVVLGGGLYWYSHKPTAGGPQVEGTSTQAAPTSVQEAVRAYAAPRLAVGPGAISVVSSAQREWSDSCLGLGGPAESCAQVITPGYEVVISVSGLHYTLRTNADGSVIRGTGVLDVLTPFHDKG